VYVIVTLLASVCVGLGTITVVQAAAFEEVSFGFAALGGFLGDTGGKLWDTRATTDVDPFNSA